MSDKLITKDTLLLSHEIAKKYIDKQIQTVVSLVKNDTANKTIALSDNIVFKTAAGGKQQFIFGGNIYTTLGETLNVNNGDVKIGATIFVVESDYPDYWYGGNNTFYALEAKENENINKNMYLLGVGDTMNKNGIYRATKYINLEELEFTSHGNDYYSVAISDLNAFGALASDQYTFKANSTNLLRDQMTIDQSNGEFGSGVRLIIRTQQGAYPKGNLQYKTRTSEYEEVVYNQPIITRPMLDDIKSISNKAEKSDIVSVESSSINGNIRLNDEEVTVYNDEEVKQEISEIKSQVLDNTIVEHTCSDLVCVAGDNVVSVLDSEAEIIRLEGNSVVNYLNLSFNEWSDYGYIGGNNSLPLSISGGTYTFSFDCNVSNINYQFILSNNTDNLVDYVGSTIVGRNSFTFTFTGNSTKFMFYINGNATTKNYAIKKGNDSTHTPYGITNSQVSAIKSSARNIWNEQWELGSYDNATGNKTATNESIRNKTMISVMPNTTYYCVGSNLRIWYFDNNNNFLSLEPSVSNATFTTPSNCYYINFRANGSTYNNDIAIIRGTSGTYEPYVDDSLVLGGKVTRKLYEIDLGDLSWSGSSGRYYTVIDNIKKINNAPMLAEKYGIADNSNPSLNTIYSGGLGGGAYGIIVGSTETPTGKLVYELATPVEEDYDGVLRGIGNVRDTLIPSPNTIRVWNNGLMQQITSTIPAYRTTRYAVNLKSQVIMNTNAIEDLEKRIDTLMSLLNANQLSDNSDDIEEEK